MANVVVVGSQWGDEGKGKIVDWLSEQADIVVRFQGGHNAGHTLVIDGVTYKLSLLPSGVVRPGKLSVIGNGVVLDPHALLEEIDRLSGAGGQRHAGELAHRRECHADPAAAPGARCHPRILEHPHARRHHQARHRPGLRGQGRPARHPPHGPRRPAGARAQDRAPAGASQCPAARARARRGRRRRRSRRQLAERAPRACCPTWIRCGRCSTASAARASASCSRARRARCSTSTTAPIRSSPRPTRWRRRRRPAPGSGRAAIGYVLGICKAYTTRVGRRAVPDRAGQRDRPPARRARPRIRHRHRAAPALRLVRRRAGAPDRAHQRDQRPGAHQARHPGRLRRDQGLRRHTAWTAAKSTICRRASTPRPQVEPVYETVEGWQAETARARSWADCRRRRSNMCAAIEELVGCPVALLSTSPEREDTILMHNPFEN